MLPFPSEYYKKAKIASNMWNKETIFLNIWITGDFREDICFGENFLEKIAYKNFSRELCEAVANARGSWKTWHFQEKS